MAVDVAEAEAILLVPLVRQVGLTGSAPPIAPPLFKPLKIDADDQARAITEEEVVLELKQVAFFAAQQKSPWMREAMRGERWLAIVALM